MKTLMRTWADISLDNLEHNYKQLRSRLPSGCRFLGVVKADAYGHGAVPVSRALENFGAEYLAVANIEEAVQIRRGSVHLPVLILGHTPADYAENMVCMDITQEVHSLSYAQELNEALSGTNCILNVHVKLDTGMTRLGFIAYESALTLPQIVELSRLPHLHIEGAFTHFAAADSTAEPDREFTRLQYARFTDMLSQMEAAGVKPEIRHCCNSGATILYPEYAMDMVRPGIAIYGAHPSGDTRAFLELRPVMSLHTSIAQIKTVPAQTAVSYGRTFSTSAERKLAVLPVGYADGLPRALSGKAAFRLHGRDVPVLGRICMDMCMVDVTDVPELRAGDTLTIFGYDEDGALVPCERLTDAIGTISYELFCQISKRVPRLYLEGGRVSEILQYID